MKLSKQSTTLGPAAAALDRGVMSTRTVTTQTSLSNHLNMHSDQSLNVEWTANCQILQNP